MKASIPYDSIVFAGTGCNKRMFDSRIEVRYSQRDVAGVKTHASMLQSALAGHGADREVVCCESTVKYSCTYYCQSFSQPFCRRKRGQDSATVFWPSCEYVGVQSQKLDRASTTINSYSIQFTVFVCTDTNSQYLLLSARLQHVTRWGPNIIFK